MTISTLTAAIPIRKATVLATCLAAGAIAALAVPTAAQAASPAPRVSAVSANHGSADGGDQITVRGAHFSHVQYVLVGGVRAGGVHVLSATKLQLTTPKHYAALTNVRVKTTSGLSPVTSHDYFTYQIERSIAGGQSHTCQVTPSGTVRCWGYNAYGQLGDGTTTTHSTAVRVSGLSNIVSVAAGYDHTCALSSGGAVYCWGLNTNGELGNGTTVNSATPVRVAGLGKALAISAGAIHTCAVVQGGGTGNIARCWGDNGTGQLGVNSTNDSSVPRTMYGLSNVVDVDGGEYFSCAVLLAGTVYCTGQNAYNQLGDGTSTNSLTPVRTVGLTHAVAISSGDYTSCALYNNGRVYCWGYGNEGELGNGSNSYTSSHPVRVTGLSGVTRLASGGFHTCALKQGTEYCWGYNAYGQLGNGTNTSSNIPTAVDDLTRIADIGAGYMHSAAVRVTTSTWSWGHNDSGQLGNGTTTDSNLRVAVS